MDTEDFKRIGGDLFGNGWQSRMARALGVDGSTVRRWVGSAIPIPPQIAAYLRMLESRQETRGALVFERQALGWPLLVKASTDETLERMERRIAFPGVEHAKPMPVIRAREDDHGITLSLSGGAGDELDAPRTSFAVTRHPDTRHLAGYVEAARAGGHRPVTVRHRFHHYTAIAHRDERPSGIMLQISTHSGTLRTVWIAHPGDGSVEREDLSILPGGDASLD